VPLAVIGEEVIADFIFIFYFLLFSFVGAAGNNRRGGDC